MDPSAEQTAAFGAEARRLRHAKDLTAKAVAAGVAEKVGARVGHQDVLAWETKYAPQTWEKAAALDEVLGAQGKLLALLGAAPDASARLDHIDARLSRVETLVQQLLDGERGAR